MSDIFLATRLLLAMDLARKLLDVETSRRYFEGVFGVNLPLNTMERFNDVGDPLVATIPMPPLL
jgi:hypothetical protein